MHDAEVSRRQLAQALGLATQEVQQWELGQRQPSTSQFHRLAKTIGRPEPFFLLPRPPNSKPTAAAFRRFTSHEPVAVTADESKALRLAERARRVTEWVRQRSTVNQEIYVPSAAVGTDPEQAADLMRKWLDWELNAQTSSQATDATVTRAMRTALQDRGIIVLHLTLGENSVRGFCLPSKSAPLIAVSTRDIRPARLFSYAHETAHLLISDQSICLTGENAGVERWCNQVAGALLMPLGDFRNHVIRRMGDTLVSSIDDVRAIRARYKVSLQACAVRLESLRLGVPGLINAYTLTFAGFLMLGGRAADLCGRRRIFLAGLAGFTLFSLLGGLAQTGAELIAARAAQGVGGAILAPATLSLLTATFTEHHERRRALGVWSATAASGAAGGLLLGGVLTSLLDWRWVLFVNVPIGAALIVTALLSLTESTGQLGSRRLDIAGAATLTGGMAILVYSIISTNTHPWWSARTIATLAAGAAMLILFVLIEGRFAQNPIVPLSTFRRRSLSVANVLSTTVGLVVFGNYFFLSLYLQEVKHYSPLRAGLAFLPIGLTTFAGALIASRLVHRLGIRRQLIIAPLVTAAAVYWLSQLSPASGYFGSLFVPLLFAGASIGVTFVPMTMAATTGVPPAEAGQASGLLNTSRQLGGALGLAVLATIASVATRHEIAHGAPAAAALNHGYARAFLVISAVAAAGAVTAIFLDRSAPLPSHRPAAKPNKSHLKCARICDVPGTLCHRVLSSVRRSGRVKIGSQNRTSPLPESR